MRRYAEGTQVSVEKSKADLEKLVRKHGAVNFLTAWDDDRGMGVVQFRIGEPMIRMLIRSPDKKEYSRPNAVEKEMRRRWRALLLITKAKLEIIAGGESTVEREFLADVMLPDGSTVGERMMPRLELAYQTGDMPKMLLPGMPDS
jgi:hypothetical protein